MAPIDTVLQKGHSPYHKYHLTKMAPHNYIIVFLKYSRCVLATPMLIEPTRTVRHRKVIGISLWSGKTLTLRSHDHESESYIYDKLQKFLLKITQLSAWQIG